MPTQGACRLEEEAKADKAKSDIQCWDGVCVLRFRPLRPNDPCIPGTGAFCFRLPDPFMTCV